MSRHGEAVQLPGEAPSSSSSEVQRYNEERKRAEQAALQALTESTDHKSTMPMLSSDAANRSGTATPSDALASSPLERNNTALSRIRTHRSQHSHTIGDSAVRKRTTILPDFGAGKPLPPPLPDQEEYVVEFIDADDPLHPHNWPFGRKLVTSVMLNYLMFISTFGSSIFSAALGSVSTEYHISREVATLGITLYILGFSTGPILWAPMSELKGRRLPLVLASFGFFIFNFAVAVGKDVQTIMICRFWAGFFGACPLAVVPASFSDMYDTKYRGISLAALSTMVFTGPLLANFIGGFITLSSLGWRWTEYLTGIMGAAAFVSIVFFYHETYPPVVLIAKAEEFRRKTKNWGIHAKQEEIELDLRQLLEKNFTRPLRMLATEPVVLLLAIYIGFIYGLLYLFLTAYEFVFQDVYGFNEGIGSLPYIGMIIGLYLFLLLMVLRQPSYERKLKANDGVTVPEWRIPEMFAGAIAFSVGLFWFGWAGYRSEVHWIVPTLSGLFTGFGLMAIFTQGFNYLVDVYITFAASAMASNTFVRSLSGACFPLFAPYMYKGMGIQWAQTLLGCVAALLVLVPVYFHFRGARLREKSAYAPTDSRPPSAKKMESDSDQV